MAQHNLGVAYYSGQGVAQGDAEAVKWYRKAAEQGLAMAQDNLGNMYMEGRGVPLDIEEGRRWIARAAEQGYSGTAPGFDFSFSWREIQFGALVFGGG